MSEIIVIDLLVVPGLLREVKFCGAGPERHRTQKPVQERRGGCSAVRLLEMRHACGDLPRV